MKKNKFLLILTLLLLMLKLNAQQRNCGTMQHLEFLQSKDPQLKVRMQDNEKKLQNWIKNNANEKLSNIIVIPVVVHVVYNNNNENI